VLLLVGAALVPIGLAAAPAQAVDNASISGTVTGPGGGPLENIEVSVYAQSAGSQFWDWVNSSSTDATGHYTVPDLAAGTYRVGFDDFAGAVFLSEYWNDKPSVEQADDVTVVAGTARTGINAALARTSTVSGTVTDGAIGLGDISVTAYDATSQEEVAFASTAPDGTYTLTDLPAGTYKIGFDDFSGNHVGEYWNDRSSLATADPVVVAASTDVTGKNAVLSTPGRITGTVTAPGGGAVSGAFVTAYQLDDGFWDEVASATTAANGTYTVAGLATGTYRVGFTATGYLDEYWNDKATVETADDIAVTQGTTTTGRDAQLATPGKITGTVTASGGGALAGIQVTAYRSDRFGFEDYAEATTNASGGYQLDGLAVGTYRLGFVDPAGTYKREFWDDKATLDTATDIPVAASQTVSGRNAALATASHITGTVTGAGGVVLAGIQVTAYDYEDGWSGFRTVQTAANGTYDIGGLEPGAYRLGFADGTGAYSPEYFDDATLFGKSAIVHVPLSTTVAGRNAQLTRSGAISGTVTNGTAGIQGITVRAYELVRGDWDLAASAVTDASGGYSIPRLRATTHRIDFRDPSGHYAAEAWNDAPDLRSGADIAVPAGSTATGKDAVLARAGEITGTVSGPGGVLQNAQVTAYRNVNGSWAFGGSAITNASGAYDVAGLSAGTYRLRFTHAAHVTEYYDDKATLETGIDVVVATGATVSGRNATLAARGSIAGTVTNGTGGGLANITVTAYRDLGNGSDTLAGSTSTSASGAYTLTNLEPGSYRLRFADPLHGFATEWYDNQPDRQGTTLVAVAAAQAVTGKDAQLAGGATISGVVTGTGGAGVVDTTVDAYRKVASGWSLDATTDTDATGHYTLTGLQAGTWRVGFEAPYGGPYLDEFWSNQPTLDTAIDIVLAAGGTAASTDAALDTGGIVSGTVTEDGGGPIADVDAVLYALSGGFWDYVRDASTDASGAYRITGLPAGTYRLELDPPTGHLREWWNNKPTLDTADDIAVAAGATVVRDAGLARAGGIGGTVGDAGGGLPGVEVTAYSLQGGAWEPVGDAETDAAGAYVVRGLAAGSYRVGFEDLDGVYARELWNDQPTIATATDVAVTAGSVTPGHDAVLGTGAHISGVVTTQGGGPLTGARVHLYQKVGGSFAELEGTYSHDTGLYFFEGLAPGIYRVGVTDPGEGYVDEYWNGAAALASATDIVLPAGGGVDNVDVGLVKQGTVSGVVTGPTGAPLAGVKVTAYRNDGGTFGAVASVSTGSGGAYALSVPPGTYRIGFDDLSGTLQDEFFDNAASLSAATDVVVASGATTSGRNAQLAATGGGPPPPPVTPAVVSSAPPTVSGTPGVGSPLTAGPGSWTPAGASFGYQWLADGAPIGGATGTTYTPVPGDVGKALAVRVTASKPGYTTGTATSAATARVAAGQIAATTPPKITGKAKVGSTLTVSKGTWSVAGAGLKYQWYAGTKAIKGATKTKLKLTKAMKGKKISASVTATAAGYASLVVRTKPSGKVR